MRVEEGPAARGQQHLARLAARFGHPLGEGLGQQGAGVDLAALPASGAARPALGQLQGVAGARRTVALQPAQPFAEVGIGAAEAGFGQDGGDARAEGGVPGVGGDGDHVSQPGRQGDARQSAAVVGQRPLPVQRPQPGQHLPRLREGPGRRRVEQGQPFRRARAPAGEIEGEGGQVGLENLGPLVRDETAGLFLVPKPVADPGPGPAGAAAALRGRGAADADGGQTGQAAGRLEARHARQAAVDDHPHPLDGQAGLRHRGGQHHLAAAGRRRFDGAVLFRLVERAIERGEVDVGRQAIGEQAGRAVNLPLSREEGEDGAALLRQRLPDGPGHRLLETLRRVATEIMRLDREHPALRFDHWRAVEEAGDAGDVERGRHHQQAQVVPQELLRLTRQGEAQVRVEAAFVKLVEQHRADAFQRRVVENHTGEHALSDHLDPGVRADAGLQAGAVADGLAGAFAKGHGHALGGGAGGQSTRLQHQHPCTAQPRLVEQRQRHDRRLARARRGGENHGRGRREGGLQRVEDGVNGQHDGLK